MFLSFSRCTSILPKSKSLKGVQIIFNIFSQTVHESNKNKDRNGNLYSTIYYTERELVDKHWTSFQVIRNNLCYYSNNAH